MTTRLGVLQPYFSQAAREGASGFYPTYCRLNLPVSASERWVIRMANRRIAKAHRFTRAKREDRRLFYGFLMVNHYAAQTVADYVAKGGR